MDQECIRDNRESYSTDSLANTICCFAIRALCSLRRFRTVHLAITSDEVTALSSAHEQGYVRLFLGSDWNSQAHFLNVLLAKPCVQLLPINEVVASRLPSLLGLGLFLWGVWRIGRQFPTGCSRALVTLALLSNAYLLDYFGLTRGYGLALGFTLLSLSWFLEASLTPATDSEGTRRPATISLWLAFGAALSTMAFAYFYAALLVTTLWLIWRKQLKASWWASALILVIFYVRRVLVTRAENQLFFGGDIGFVHDTVSSLVRASFYDLSVPDGLVRWAAVVVVLLVLALAYWSHREPIRAGFHLALLGISAALVYVGVHELLNVKYPVERAALYLVPLVILNISVVGAWSRFRQIRLCLWRMLFILIATGLQGVNLGHTLTCRTSADIPAALLAFRDIHQKTGQHLEVATSDDIKWSVWYYAEHLLGLDPKPRTARNPYLRNYDWLTVYEWKAQQAYFKLPLETPLLPGTAYVFLDRNDERLLATHLAGGLVALEFYPNSDMRLSKLAKPGTPRHLFRWQWRIECRPGSGRDPKWSRNPDMAGWADVHRRVSGRLAQWTRGWHMAGRQEIHG